MKKILLLAVVAIVAVVAVLLLHGPKAERLPVVEEKEAKPSHGLIEDAARPRSRADKTKNPKKKDKAVKVSKRRAKGTVVVESDMTPAEQELSDAVQEALDNEDFDLTLERAKKALQSTNQDLRQEAVDAIGWFDEKGLEVLSSLMADKNEDIAESARDYVETALNNMDYQDFAFAQAVAYLDEYGGNDEVAEMLKDVMSFAGGQIIDPEDDEIAEDVADAKENRACIVDVVSSMIEQGGKMAERGKEIYEDITGEEWTGLGDAGKWANDVGDAGDDAESDDDAESGDDAKAQES